MVLIRGVHYAALSRVQLHSFRFGAGDLSFDALHDAPVVHRLAVMAFDAQVPELGTVGQLAEVVFSFLIDGDVIQAAGEMPAPIEVAHAVSDLLVTGSGANLANARNGLPAGLAKLDEFELAEIIKVSHFLHTLNN